MPPLTLPPRSPATLRAFWLVMSAGAGVGAGLVAAAVSRDRRLLVIGMPVAAATAIPGLTNPKRVDLPYRAWNKGGRIVGESLADTLSRLGFLVVRWTRAVGDRSTVPIRSTGTSGWQTKLSQPKESFRHQDTLPVSDGHDAFDRYVRQPGNEWAEAVRPLVRLIGALETDADEPSTPPSDVYTLY